MVLYNLELMVVKYLHAECVTVGRKNIGKFCHSHCREERGQGFKNRDACNSKPGAFFDLILRGHLEIYDRQIMLDDFLCKIIREIKIEQASLLIYN